MKTNDIFPAATATFARTRQTVAKRERSAFTLVEILTVLAIITMLVALFVPSLTMVRRIAKETKQRAQFAAMEGALTTFRNDQGYYPPSNDYIIVGLVLKPLYYGGAQKLTEALLGRDLMGFHPLSDWTADSVDFYPPPPTTPAQQDAFQANLRERRGRYIELDTANAFRLGNDPPGNPGLFSFDLWALERNTFVICDVFGAKSVTLKNGKVVKAGAPVLYYRANPHNKTINDPLNYWERTYDARDNQALLKNYELAMPDTPQPLLSPITFYEFIDDPRVPKPDPDKPYCAYRPDSYILISAGADGIYGTPDDIRNFGD
ncbi:MAG: type II secretion system protein [Planctomycetota bacterium]|jgi:type II secretory pathway pseudopilin PulG